jgi:hypothetical protein
MLGPTDKGELFRPSRFQLQSPDGRNGADALPQDCQILLFLFESFFFAAFFFVVEIDGVIVLCWAIGGAGNRRPGI